MSAKLKEWLVNKTNKKKNTPNLLSSLFFGLMSVISVSEVAGKAGKGFGLRGRRSRRACLPPLYVREGLRVERCEWAPQSDR